jgi:hypothetical protein
MDGRHTLGLPEKNPKMWAHILKAKYMAQRVERGGKVKRCIL